MKKQFLAIKALLFCLLYFTATQASFVPTSLYGHWFKTDGSNRFIIGIYSGTACYQNEMWRIYSAEEVQGRWRLTLEQGGRTTMVTLQPKDSATILLGSGKQEALKNIRTFNNHYRPEQPLFSQPGTAGSALVKGLIQWKEKPEKEQYVELSYKDVRTGKLEYLFADLDSLDGFSFRIPLHMPAFCNLSIGRGEPTTFLVQPGDTMLVALNTTISPNVANTDHNKLLQYVCLMGSDAAFNNQYLHYTQYLGRFDFKQAKLTTTYYSGMPDTVKQQQYTRYSKLYDSIVSRIDVTYPTYAAEQRFIEFIKSEARYNCVLAMFNELTEEIYLQKIYDQYLAQETPAALVHDSYYKLANRYALRLYDIRVWRRSGKPDFEKLRERAQKDYGPLLTDNLVEQSKVIQRDWSAINKMEDSAVIQKYFNGSREAAYRFRQFFDKIAIELGEETSDSIAYSFNKTAIPNVCLRFAANVKQLNGTWSDDERLILSDYRVALYRQYGQLPGMPDLQIQAANKTQALLFAAASAQLKLDAQRFQQIDHEAEWQAALKSYRGKTVITWTFYHYFEKKDVARSLYELQKLQERYRGKNVVFLKCIEQRLQGDRIAQLLKYLDIFNEHNQLNDVFYINRKLSMGAMMNEAINKVCAIYNTSGQAHHPQYSSTLTDQLDDVLAGNGNYNEGKANYYLQAADTYSGYGSANADNKTWTLYDASGSYSLYTSREPEKPVYELNYDSVYHQLLFMKNAVCMERDLVFHEQPADYSYSKQHTNLSQPRTYQFNDRDSILRVYEGKGKLYRSYRVVFITAQCLVLELIQ